MVDWADVFTQKRNAEVITDSLAYCQKEKGSELSGYVLMPRHLHCRLVRDAVTGPPPSSKASQRRPDTPWQRKALGACERIA